MNKQNAFTKENIMLYIVIIMQIYALTFYGKFGSTIAEQKQIFRSGVEFEAVSAECTDVREVALSGRANSAKVYNNTYEYEVNGEVYSVTFLDEDKKGEDDLLYYNPNAPETCSRYSSLSDALAKESGRLVFALVMQCLVIAYAIWRWKTRE